MRTSGLSMFTTKLWAYGSGGVEGPLGTNIIEANRNK